MTKPLKVSLDKSRIVTLGIKKLEGVVEKGIKWVGLARPNLSKLSLSRLLRLYLQIQ